jgi:hypothetical protein
MSDLTTAIIGVMSGIAASAVTTLFSRWFEKRNADQASVQKYSKPIWLACNDLRFRLESILEKLKNPNGNASKVLIWQGNGGEKDIVWMNGHGYFVTSTAYLLSAVSSWFHIVERKLVFLPFGDESQSLDFFQKVRQVQMELTTRTPLWFYYLAGVGQMLLDKEENQPMTYGQFVLRMKENTDFSHYFDQLFNGFIQQMGEGRITEQVERAVKSLAAVEQFLQDHAGVPAKLIEKRSS